MFFHTWSDLARPLIVAAILFALLVVILRVLGQKALAKMSGYDIIVTITIGSILASAILTRSITIAEAVVALLALFGLQEGTRWLQARYLAVHHFVRQAPRVLLWDGQLLEDRLRKHHISADEVRAAVRRMGFRSLSDIRIVVLENDGDWSVVAKNDKPSDESALFGLQIPGRVLEGGVRIPSATPAPADRLP